jgi:hypothetical protein
MVAEYLAREPDPRQTTSSEQLFLGSRHLRRLTLDEFDATRRAPRVPAACVHDIDAGVLLDREYQSLVRRDLNSFISFNH